VQLVRLENHPNPGVQDVVRKLREGNTSGLKEAQKEEKRIHLHGLAGLQ
jgi:hypothetical protein